jgi:hypothetical protein
MHNFLYIILGIFIFSGQGHAQDAMGSGNALDNNLSTSGRENHLRKLPRGTTNSEIRTNSILAGRNFNEGIGLDTQAHMQLISDASDADAQVLADTLNNSPWYWDNWNNASAQYILQGDANYFNPHFIDNWAQSPMNVRVGRSMQSISHTWSTEDDNSDQSAMLNYPSSWSGRQIDQHRLAQATGSTYDPTGSYSTIPVVGNLRTTYGLGYIMASPLRGISVETTNHAAALGLTPWDAARAKEDDENSNTLITRWVTDTGLTDRGVKIGEQVASAHDSIMESVSNRALDQLATDVLLSEQPKGWLEQQYGLLQGQLAGTIPFDEESDEFVAVTEEGSGETDETEKDATNEIAFILQHGQQIEKLTSEDQTRFNELMTIAQERFEKGEYFWSERRYDRALRFTPGHPFATAGLGHSRIGAGMYLSASLTLQSLLSLQPEMIDVTYAKNLLPPRLDLVKAAVLITGRLDEKRDGGTYAFLLSYIGHQLGDLEMIERGLDVFEKREGANDPLVRLLKKIWL